MVNTGGRDLTRPSQWLCLQQRGRDSIGLQLLHDSFDHDVAQAKNQSKESVRDEGGCERS